MTDHPDMTALSAYLDGELDAGHTERTARHLAECPQCRALLDELRTLSLGLQALAIDAPPIDLSARLDNLLANQPARRLRPGWRQRLPATFGAAASILLGLFLGSALQPTPSTAIPAEVSILAVLGSAPPGALCARPELCYLKVNLT
jgi:anti-sigma factor RsiW